MGAFTLGNADRQETLTVNRNETVGGSGVLNKPVTRNSGNVRNVLQRGATLDQRTITNVQGISEDRIAEILSSFSSQLEPVSAPIVIPITGGTAAPGASSPVAQAIEERMAGNVNEGTPDSKGTIKTVLWIAAAGFGFLVLIVGGGLLLLRKKKGTA